jgi:electron transport complex protein RnfA
MVRSSSPVLYEQLGVFLPLITTNCAVLGVALMNQNLGHDLLESLVFGAAAAAGFGLVLLLFAALRERLEYADMPRAFRGAPIALITAGLMALAFMGFSGLGLR